MRIVALLTVYNEELYVRSCIEHLIGEGVEVCLVDNDSTDRTRQIAESFVGRGVIRIERIPRRGMFELEPLLKKEEELAVEIGADWYIHHDADEIRQAPRPFRTLREGIEAVDEAGFNAIDFDEFVFVPTSDTDDFTTGGYPHLMKYYYFFEPAKGRRINAWKHTGQRVDLHSSGGHAVSFPDRRVYGTNFVLRHYMGLSRNHIIRKYCGRVVSEDERITRGWNNARASLEPDQLELPDANRLKRLSSDNTWDRSEPWTHHAIFERSKLLPRREAGRPNEDVREQAIGMVVGVEGSGTEILRHMLARHPLVGACHFPLPVVTAIDEFGSRGGDPRSFLDAVSAHFPRETTHALSEWVAQEEFTLSEGVRRLLRLECQAGRDSHIVVEAPATISRLIQIWSLLPEARFVHVIRDGRDVPAHPSSDSTARDVEQEASRWVWVLAQARRQAQRLPHYMEVRYENLLSHPVQEIARVLDFLEIGTADEVLQRLVPGEVAPTSGRGTDRMTSRERERFESVAGPTLIEFGYELGI